MGEKSKSKSGWKRGGKGEEKEIIGSGKSKKRGRKVGVKEKERVRNWVVERGRKDGGKGEEMKKIEMKRGRKG